MQRAIREGQTEAGALPDLSPMAPARRRFRTPRTYPSRAGDSPQEAHFSGIAARQSNGFEQQESEFRTVYRNLPCCSGHRVVSMIFPETTREECSNEQTRTEQGRRRSLVHGILKHESEPRGRRRHRRTRHAGSSIRGSQPSRPYGHQDAHDRLPQRGEEGPHSDAGLLPAASRVRLRRIRPQGAEFRRRSGCLDWPSIRE